MKEGNRSFWVIGTALIAICFVFLASTPLVLAQTANPKTDVYMEILGQLFRYVQDNYVEEVNPEILFEGAAKGLVESLDDPYSYYLTSTDMEDMSDTTKGNFGGVGLYISKYLEDGSSLPDGRLPYIYVVSPIEGTPAYRAGIHAGDYIYKIEGKTTEDLSSSEAADLLRGVPGTKVNITILRGRDIYLDISLERAIIEIPTVRHGKIGQDIGYLRIIQFTPFTADRVRDAVTDMGGSRTLSGLIIDVRSNPGGLLDSVVKVADLFMSSGIIVGTQSRIPRENEQFRARSATLIPNSVPIIVLIDKGSASASEILAGALKDTKRALLIGENTFGKGSVQHVIPLPNRGGLRLTTSRYYTPSGTLIDKIGVAPDRVITEPEFTEAESDILRMLLQENKIASYVASNPQMNDLEIEKFITSLIREGFTLERRLLKRLIKNEYYRKEDFPPPYDLEYDIVLQEAVNLLKEGVRRE